MVHFRAVRVPAPGLGACLGGGHVRPDLSWDPDGPIRRGTSATFHTHEAVAVLLDISLSHLGLSSAWGTCPPVQSRLSCTSW